jgi:hypothetical protein
MMLLWQKHAMVNAVNAPLPQGPRGRGWQRMTRNRCSIGLRQAHRDERLLNESLQPVKGDGCFGQDGHSRRPRAWPRWVKSTVVAGEAARC